MTTVTSGREALLALADRIKSASGLSLMEQPKQPGPLWAMPLGDAEQNLIVAVLRLATKPADEEVREATIEECAKIADAVSAVLSDYSKRAEAVGDTQTMYRSNTAWHNTVGIAESIRALSTTGKPKP